MNEPKLLFFTRKLPPQVGGMEQHSAALLEALSLPIFLIGLRKKQHHLLWWMPYAFINGCLHARKSDMIFVQDALLTPLGSVIGMLFRKPVVVTAHGLDIIYHPGLYQRMIGFFLPRADHVICVSRATKIECEKRGVPSKNITVIPNGIYLQEEISVRQKSLLLLGRLVERKGSNWFIKEVLPKLPKDIRVDIVGAGPLMETLKSLSANDPRVNVHGKLSDEKLKDCLKNSGALIMPNIRKEGDMEGFGITAIEAGAWGVPVVVADIEGLSDAVIPEKTGKFFTPMDARECLDAISTVLSWDAAKRAEIKKTVQRQFSWKEIGKQYEQVFYSIYRRS